MTNEQAIEWLKIIEKDYMGNPSIAISLAIQALEKTRWIPVSERLPEIRQYEDGEPIEFNVMLRYGTVATTGCINKDGQWGEMCWVKAKFYPFVTDVIAWQPLPEPHKEENHD